jgi:hypothetical protein
LRKLADAKANVCFAPAEKCDWLLTRRLGHVGAFLRFTTHMRRHPRVFVPPRLRGFAAGPAKGPEPDRATPGLKTEEQVAADLKKAADKKLKPKRIVSGFESHPYFSETARAERMERRGFKRTIDAGHLKQKAAHDPNNKASTQRPDARTARPAEDYREINDTDPYAEVFNERASVGKVRLMVCG